MKASTNDLICYFGYGSLVNRATHRTDIQQFERARLKGWRRHWLPRPQSKFGDIALLSVWPEAANEIDGLLVVDHARNLPALDAREIGYHRSGIGDDCLNLVSSTTASTLNFDKFPPVSIYVAKDTEIFDGTEKCRILRSYLDAVMQGYLNKFGHEGLCRFVATTDNFDIGMLEDRKTPKYPRAVDTTTQERRLFDELVPANE